MADAKGYKATLKNKVGWRYGFVASLKDGNRVYSQVYKRNDGKAEFVVPQNTEYLWLVVSGAPTEHEKHSWDNDKEVYRSFPYKVKFINTKPL